MLVNKNFRSKIHECFSPFFCSRDEKVSFSCHSHLSKSCFLVRCLLKGPINISIRPGFLTFCHLLLTTVRTPAYLQGRRNQCWRGYYAPAQSILPWKTANPSSNDFDHQIFLTLFDLPTALSFQRLQRPQQLP